MPSGHIGSLNLSACPWEEGQAPHPASVHAEQVWVTSIITRNAELQWFHQEDTVPTVHHSSRERRLASQPEAKLDHPVHLVAQIHQALNVSDSEMGTVGEGGLGVRGWDGGRERAGEP
jgi:hypothetical protein